MNYKKMSQDDLMLNLGVVLEQVQVVKRGLKEHPEDEIFQKAVPFMIEESEKIMKEFTRRSKADIDQDIDSIIVDDNDGKPLVFIQTLEEYDDYQMIPIYRDKIPQLIELLTKCIK